MIADISTERMQERAPAVFADDRYEGTSDRFQFISTAQVVDTLRDEGFVPVRAKQSNPRIKARRNHSRHMVVFRVPHQATLRQRGDVAPEVILFNAHDGTSAYRLIAGVFRLVCENGLIVSDGTVAALRIPHSRKHSLDEVVQGTHALVKVLPDVLNQIDTWKSTDLSETQRFAYAHDALRLRFGSDDVPVSATQVLQPRRAADGRTDLFTVFNVVQENLLRGGLVGQRRDGKRVTTRRLNAIDTTTRLNLGLWELTSEYSYSLN